LNSVRLWEANACNVSGKFYFRDENPNYEEQYGSAPVIPQKIGRVRRNYNVWVANQTMEDFSLRFTAKSARRWSPYRVGNTALGAISFLALETIGGSITYQYGFTNAAAAIVAVGILIFLTGLPISYYAAKHGIDIDLLSRGAGFGYIGSTLTSLIYASFTFIFFAIEAAIMAKALEMFLNIPMFMGYILSSMIVIPIVINGFTFISRFQIWTQPIWVFLHVLPFVFIATNHSYLFKEWTGYSGVLGNANGSFNILLFGAASAVIFSLSAQIGEQVDFLRFLPPKNAKNKVSWWISLLSAGPGWMFVGGLKIFAGSFLVFLCLKMGIPVEMAGEPTYMYQTAFQFVFASSWAVAFATATFVIVSQIKINVTNAYAGSIAWSNFFSRLTHSHPGRVVWLIFNVGIAFLLVTLGAYQALEQILGLYSIIAVAWVGALSSDLVINKPLGLSPKQIEFRRAYLYDINPVGVGAVLLAIMAAMLSYTGLLGNTLKALSSYLAFGVAFTSAPIIAYLTGGKYYIARPPDENLKQLKEIECCICQSTFESEDMAGCPIYDGPICSLCCSLDARCHDSCKKDARYVDQIFGVLTALLPHKIMLRVNSSVGHYIGIQIFLCVLFGSVLGLVFLQSSGDPSAPMQYIENVLWDVFLILIIISGVATWLFVLAREGAKFAQAESSRQTFLLSEEIAAHTITDKKLQKAKEVAEAANLAKSRYIVGLNHEFRTPLNTILGYSQLLERDSNIPNNRVEAIQVIRKGSEHLAELIEGLLDISKIEEQYFSLNKDTIQLSAFLDEIALMFQLESVSKDVKFTFLTEGYLPEIIVSDKSRLRQIYINILSNAFKYTPFGDIKLTVKFIKTELIFCVEDTGVGISKKDITRIFNPFERALSTELESTVVGNGLGLSISKLLTERMGGKLLLESEVGVGSIFSVKIPISDMFTRDKAKKIEIDRDIIGYEGPRKSIIVTDDDPAHCELVKDILSPLGFDLYTANRGKDCLLISEKNIPSLFLIDISMPEMDGFELSKNIRSLHGKKSPIILISANTLKDVNIIETPHFFDDYLMKPFVYLDLLEKIRAALDLTWVYQTTPSLRQPSKGSIDKFNVMLPESHINDLLVLGRTGHVRALQEELEELELKFPECNTFLLSLREQVDNFDLEGFMKLLSENQGKNDA
jgi:signal transduction histidine kinase/CheY-like chemotaxis protein